MIDKYKTELWTPVCVYEYLFGTLGYIEYTYDLFWFYFLIFISLQSTVQYKLDC